MLHHYFLELVLDLFRLQMSEDFVLLDFSDVLPFSDNQRAEQSIELRAPL